MRPESVAFRYRVEIGVSETLHMVRTKPACIL